MISALLATLLVPQLPAPPNGQQTAERVLVAAESADEVYDIAFDGKDLSIREVVPVGYQATEIEGPHGLTVDPTGKFWYLLSQ